MSQPKFLQAQPIVNFPEVEASIQQFWQSNSIFEKSLKIREGRPKFVFYEGPPTANGMPHNGHVLTRVFKDVFLRYRTMRGFHVPRKAGWDTHGLPVEVEVEKELGAMIPKPQPKKVLTGGISGTAAAAPKSSLEAMKAELARQAA